MLHDESFIPTDLANIDTTATPSAGDYLDDTFFTPPMLTRAPKTHFRLIGQEPREIYQLVRDELMLDGTTAIDGSLPIPQASQPCGHSYMSIPAFVGTPNESRPGVAKKNECAYGGVKQCSENAYNSARTSAS